MIIGGCRASSGTPWNPFTYDRGSLKPLFSVDKGQGMVFLTFFAFGGWAMAKMALVEIFNQ